MNCETLGAILANLAASAIRVQTIFDQRAAQDEQQFVNLLANVPAPWREGYLSIAPPRLRISTLKVAARVRFSITHGIGFFIGAELLNFGADLRFARTTAQDSRISVEVSQVPLNQETELWPAT